MTLKNDVEVQTIYNHRHYKYDEPSVLVVILYKRVPVFEGDYFKRFTGNGLMKEPYNLDFVVSDCIIEPDFARLLAEPIANKKIHDTINNAFLKQKGNQEA